MGRKQTLRLALALLLVAVLVTLVAGLFISLQQIQQLAADGKSVIPPDGKAYYGVQLSWEKDTPEAYTSRLGKAPAVFGDYRSFPLTSADRQALSREVDQVAAVHGKLMLTLEPREGLSKVTERTAHDLSSTLDGYNSRGVDIFVRFAQEMNGSWYPWGQHPAAYVSTFRVVAKAIHQNTLRSFMVWAPNYGGGYPFLGGAYNVRPGTADFQALDTNHDGVLTMADDPYGPYYPGDASVDWVGFTDYHWGNSWPWGHNDLPEVGKFVADLTGIYHGLLGDERAVPNFYAAYAVGHKKPFVLTETSALYNPDRTDGAPDYAIKMDWAKQVFAPNLLTQFPRFKMALWFEHYKSETGTGPVDWRVTSNLQVLTGYKSVLPNWLIFSH
jgi:hypothetical protein